MECSLLYVSRSTIRREVLALEIADIIAVSREHNARAGITGGLVRAGGYFAQLLEGSSEAVKALMERIERDSRHTDVSVVRIAASSKRRLLTGRWPIPANRLTSPTRSCRCWVRSSPRSPGGSTGSRC